MNVLLAAPSEGGPIPLDRARREWEEQGYLVLPRFYSDSELDAASTALRDVWQNKHPRVVVDDLATNVRQRLLDVSDEARQEHRFKVNDLYLESEATRLLALNERIVPILTSLLGSVPVLCNSLNLWRGSAQADHVDSLYMTPRSEHKLVAIWIALEDVHADAGPLRYFPGSHKIPQYVFSTGSHHVVPAEVEHWTHYMQAQIAERGLQPANFLARKGDVFIWSAYLLHGGSPINDPARTRSSLVFHYFSVEDCVALGSTLVPQGGAYWMHRPHQEVPGLASEAPPLPPNALVRA